ncbi:MAG TPA: sensor histidine kinase [Steroidobacteraceae bacterium]|nr:sensor histidine kinase [Steroidobacteraceae bacterium]
MEKADVQRLALADYMASRRAAILDAWRNAIKRDPALNTGDSLPRVQSFDHIPAILSTFERGLRQAHADGVASARDAAQEPAAAHGLQRWQQGYDLREVTRELGKLNECVIAELDGYTGANPQISQVVIAAARRVWAALCSAGIEESVGQYFQLQQQEAAGHVRDLESALSDIQELEKQRADLWRRAAHDLRGNLGVVANATVGLAHGALHEGTRDDFVRILMRNVTTLHHLLDDVTSLARLEAGREHRQIEPIDVSPIFQQLCEGIRPLAQHHRLFLRCEGPEGFAADGDAVKIRRIAQNLILNAVKYTREGGITVTWGDCGADDRNRWELRVVDTGPGIHSGSAEPLAQALSHASGEPVAVERPSKKSVRDEAGEGIGLSIVKRLCELLDATVELKSVKDVGTTFRILFPRKYLT